MSDKNSQIKAAIIAAAKDAAMNFGYYDRKEDEELSVQDLENAIKEGIVTIDEIVAAFRSQLEGE